VNGEKIDKITPTKISVKRKQPKKRRSSGKKREIVYEFKKEGYNSVEIVDQAVKKRNLVTFFSWFPFIVPGVIDAISGANNHYNKNHFVQMQPTTHKYITVTDTIVKKELVVKTDTVVKKEIVYVDSNTSKPKYVFERKSDINKDLPIKSFEKSRRFALIIGNEDYSSHQVDLSSEVDVHFARNDASAFKDYAVNVFGIPERNITFLLDATTGQMKQAIAKLTNIIKSTYGEAEVIVYYAGHGMPDEVTKEPYIMPVDVSGQNVKDAINLNEFYKRLTEFPSQRITVFIDACFSGGAREQGLLAARAVKVQPRENILNGNLVVFAASSGDQSSLPFNEQFHGLYTYYLLKFLKEKGADVTYGEIMDYLMRNIELESVLINDKVQTPQINFSPNIDSNWKEWNFK
jgi:hypothetical protein